MKPSKLFSICLGCLLGLGIISTAGIYSNTNDAPHEASAATSSTDKLKVSEMPGKTSSGRFSWSSAPAGTTSYPWSGYYWTLANNQTITFTWTRLAGMQVKNINTFNNILRTDLTKSGSALSRRMITTCGDYNSDRTETSAGANNLWLTDVTPANPAQRAGVTFSITNVSGQTAYFIAKNEDTRPLSIEYEPITSTVSLNQSSGSGGISSVTVDYGSSMPTISSLPTRAGYVFQGYYDAASGGTQYYTSAGKSARTWNKDTLNTTLYAQWTPAQYTVSFNSNGGSTVANKQVTYNSTYGTLTEPTRKAYRFDGWYKESTFVNLVTAQTKVTATQNHTLYAKWTLMQFNVTLNQQGGTGGTELVVATYGQTMPFATMPTRTGYEFLGYYDALAGGKKYYNANGTSASTYDKTEASTLYARWNALNYKASFSAAPGTGGLSELDVTYDEDLPDLTSDQIPSLASSSSHSYSFGGYFTEAPTQNEDGSFTPHGKQYYDKDGKGVEAWHEASDTTLYAYYTIDMEVTSSGYTGVWDGNNHNISVNVNFPEGTTTYYGESASSCNNPNASDFLKSEAGEYEIYYEVRLEGYTPFPGHETINISKDESIIDPRPTARTGLEFNSEDQALINTGTVDYGKMLYAVNTIGELPDESEFLEEVPTGHDVGTYYVFYMSSGDNNHNPYPLSMSNRIEVDIAEVDKVALGNLIDKTNDYLNEISEAYPEIADTLAGVKDNVKLNVYDELNVTVEQVNNAIETLKEALSKAKARVVEEKIKDIGTVSYTEESKDLIDTASNYLDNVLTIEDKAYVDLELLLTLESDKELYYHVDNVVKHIIDLTPEDSLSYVEDVNEASELYNNLTGEEKAILPENYLKDLDDNLLILPVMEKINDIGNVQYSEESKDLIDQAREAYEALSEDQKELIKKVNYNELTHDEEVYNNVDNVYSKINNIGDVELTPTSKEKIDEARHDYDSLSAEEKALIDNSTYQTLDDDEHVYTALEKIEAIGSIEYSDESKALIEEARSYFDSLSAKQKAELGQEPLSKLENSEATFTNFTNVGNILSIIGMVISILTLILGCYVMYRLLKNKKKDGKKVMSIAIIAPAILASLYIQGTFLILYIIIALNIIVWLTDLIIYLYKKNHKNKVSSISEKEETESIESEDEEVVSEIDEEGHKYQIRYLRSFLAKLIQSSDETKAYYEELKNEALSYNLTSSRVSWHYDSINVNRNQFVKFGIRGKKLCVYFPLNVEDYVDSKYKVEHIESKKYEKVPCMYRIDNPRRVKYAKELMMKVAKKLKLEKGELPSTSYYLAYEERDPLIKKGLIKVLKSSLNVLEEEEVINVVEDGITYQIRFNRSFTARMIQSSSEIHNYYNEIKNYILSFDNVSTRTSWNYESFNSSKKQLLKIAFRGKTLVIYYALNVDEVDPKYQVEKIDSKRYEEVSCLYRITSKRRVGYSKQLINLVMRNNHLKKGEAQETLYEFEYEDRASLLNKGLIREEKVKVKK